MRVDNPWTRAHRRRGVALLAAAGLVFAAACGGDDAGSASTDAPSDATGADDVEPDITDAEPDGDGDGSTEPQVDGEVVTEPSGEPISVMTICPIDTALPPYPALCETATLYERWVNERGGIAGRPLEVTVCDERGDVNEAAACARRAVEDDVVAVVAPFSWDATLAVQIVEEAGIAWFGGVLPAVPPEYASPVSFPFGSLFPQPVGGVLRMVDDGCASPVFVLQDVPYGHLVEAVADEMFARIGDAQVDASFVYLSPTSQDYTAQAAQAVAGDCINAVISEAQWGQWLTALGSVGLGDQRLYGPQGNLSQPVVDQFPDVLEGATVISHYPSLDDPAWDDFREAIDTYQPADHDYNSLVGLGSWAAYHAFDQIASGIDGTIDAESFLSAANATTALDLDGQLPVFDLSTPWDGQGGFYPRVLVRHVYFDTVENGQIVSTGAEPVEMSDILHEPLPG